MSYKVERHDNQGKKGRTTTGRETGQPGEEGLDNKGKRDRAAKSQ